ncbi:MAG: hypothetical protein ACRECA_07110, partial [Pseudolabrys sp.]
VCNGPLGQWPHRFLNPAKRRFAEGTLFPTVRWQRGEDCRVDLFFLKFVLHRRAIRPFGFASFFRGRRPV